MAERKYMTELALSFYSDGMLLIHPKDIKKIDKQSDEARDIASKCHIYFIVIRPKISYVPNSINVSNGYTTGKFQYSKKGKNIQVDFKLLGEANADKIEISDFPHNEMTLIKDGKRFFTAPAHLMISYCDEIEDKSLLDFQVVYIGMSYAKGKRSAQDRLQSHSTLQQVLSDLTYDKPEEESLLIMAEYASPQTIITFDGREDSFKDEDDRDLIHDLKRQENEITKDLQISLVEAGLIKYFEPHYNEKYKKHFPKPTHEILKEVYDIDFGALTVEMNTEEISSRLYSKKRKAGFHHIANYDLHNLDIRRSFFNLMNVSSGANAEDISGPVF